MNTVEIAAINGAAYGGGLALAGELCDFTPFGLFATPARAFFEKRKPRWSEGS